MTTNILQLSQGHYRSLHGMTAADAHTMFLEDDAAFVAKYPTSYPSPCWRFQDVGENSTPNMGYEWYRIVDERLELWKTNYDSSG